MSTLHERRATATTALANRRVRITADLRAQLPGEIDLPMNEHATVLECPVDNFWCKVRTDDGRIGLCPIGFVEIAHESTQKPSPKSPPLYDAPPEASSNGVSAALPLYDTVPGDAEAELASPDATYTATLIADFRAEFPNEMSCRRGERVIVLSCNNDDWSSCMSRDNKRRLGLVPTAYLQFDEGEQGNYDVAESATSEPHYTYTPPADVRTVLYDYNTGVDGDLVATAGESVAVLKYLDADWCMARSERTGHEGMIAINYLDTKKSPRHESDDIRWRRGAWGREGSTSTDVNSYMSAQADTLTPLPSESNSQRFANAFSSTSSTAAPRSYSADVPPSNNDDWFAGFDAAKEVATAQQRRSMPPPRPSAAPSIAPAQKSLKTTIPPISADDKSKRADLHRELLESEQKFTDECAAVDECLAAERPVEGIDLTALRAGIGNVVSLSRSLTDGFRREIENRTYSAGSVFCEHEQQLRNTYNQYWQGNDRALALLDTYYQSVQLKLHLDEMLSRIRRRCPAIIDLHSALCKPVQRMLRYPVYLHKLLKMASADSDEQAMLLVAVHIVEELAMSINESKRRKELAKYRHMNERGMSAKLAKLNMHSIRKKSSRFTARLSSTLGLSHLEEDQRFTVVEQQYRHMQRCVQALLAKIKICTQAEQALASARSRMCVAYTNVWRASCKEEHGDVTQKRHATTALLNIQSRLANVVLNDHCAAYIRAVNKWCIAALEAIQLRCKGPDNVIAKRRDKLLDYSSVVGRKGQDEQWFEECRLRHAEYEALNRQLIDELPVLTREAYTITLYVIDAYNQLHTEYACKTDETLKSELPAALNNCLSRGDDVLSMCKRQHASAYNLLVSTPQTLRGKVHMYKNAASSSASSIDKQDKPSTFNLFGTASARRSGGKLKSAGKVRKQTEVDRETLHRRYRPDQLYTALRDQLVVDPVELPVRAGDLIGALITRDPSGRGDRWCDTTCSSCHENCHFRYCDNGAEKGLVCKDNLQPLSGGALPTESPKKVTKTTTPPARPASTPAQHDTPMPLISLDSPAEVKVPKIPSAAELGFTDLLDVDFSSSGSTLSGSQSTIKSNPVDNKPPWLPPTGAPPLLPARQNYQSMSNVFASELSFTATPAQQQQPVTPPSYMQPVSDKSEWQMKPIDWSAPKKPEPESHPVPASPTIHTQLPPSPKCAPPQPPLAQTTKTPSPERSGNASPETCIAAYDYMATDENQLTVSKDDVLFILSRADQSGNVEWWLCENYAGDTGYVPANYLTPL